jgi:Tol biopolymer transport system component
MVRANWRTDRYGGRPGIFYQPRLAPSGDRIAFNRPEAQTGNRDVWLIDVARGLAAPLTEHASNDWNAVWSADGKRVAFNSDRDGTPVGKVFLKQSLDTAGGEGPLPGAAGAPSDWSRDGE